MKKRWKESSLSSFITKRSDQKVIVEKSSKSKQKLKEPQHPQKKTFFDTKMVRPL